MKLVLGRIITDISNFKELCENKNLQITSIECNYIENLTIPTLIIGWSKVKELFGDGVSILNKKIKTNLFWTFNPKEKLQHFNEDIDKFILELYSDLVNQHKYQFIDPIIDNIINIDHLFRYTESGRYDCMYLTDDFIYLFYSLDKLVLGLDINYYNQLGFNTDKIIKILIENTDLVLTEDYTDDGVYQTYKKYLRLDFEKKFIPLLELKNS